MNWIEGLETWGVPAGMEFAGAERRGEICISRYRKGVLERAVRNYYAKGGARFYPNGSVFSDAVKAIRDAGRTSVADELSGYVREHVETIRKNGVLYPPHEVRFEQTIVSPALSILSAYYALVDSDPAVLDAAREHAEMLVRFDGEQPDHKWNTLPIRHWDGYWFGKRALYGDTQHYWSCLTAYALLLHGRNAGDATFRARARKTLRNLLCQFFRTAPRPARICTPTP